MFNKRFAFLLSTLAFAASPTSAQENEYFTVPPQVFAPGSPARPTVTYLLVPGRIVDDFDLTPIVVVTDEVAFSTVGLQYFSASGIPLLIGEYQLGSAEATQSVTGVFDSNNQEPPVFTAAGGAQPTIVISSDWGLLPTGMEGHQTTSVVTVPAVYGPGVSLAVGDFVGTFEDAPGDVVLAHPAGLTVFEGGINTAGEPELLEVAHLALLTADLVIEDVTVGDLGGGDDGDEIVVATRDQVTGAGSVRIYKVQETMGNVQIVQTQAILTGAMASVHVLEADPGTSSGDDIIAVEHSEVVGTSAVQVKVRLFQYDPDLLSFFESSNSPLLTRSSPIGILPRYGAVGDIDGDPLLTDDLVLMSNNAIVGPLNTSVTAPLYIDRFASDGAGNFTVTTRFTRFGGRAVDPVLYNPSTLTVSTAGFDSAGFSGSAPPLPALHATFDVDLSAGSSTSHQVHNETFGFVFKNDGAGGFEDHGPELVHAPSEFLDGVGDGHVGDLDGDAAASTGGPDVVLPLRDSNEVRVQYGDGVGLGSRVETFTAVAVPPATSGGPMDVWSGDLDGLNWHDVVVWSEYGSAARWNVHLESAGAGNGTFPESQEIVLPSGGDMVVADATSDGIVDLVATQHTALSSSVLLTVARGASNGSFATPTTLAADAGVRCFGGLAYGDYDGDATIDFVTTYRSGAGSVGALPNTWGYVVIESTGGTGYTRKYESLGPAVDAPSVESVALATTDGAPHVAIGAFTGELWMARNSGGSIDVISSLFQEAHDTCGGDVVFLDVDGDGDLDLVSSKSEVSEQANVNLLVDDGTGNQFKYVDELQGWSASLAASGNRVLGADFNDDGLTDIVLSHGRAGAVSLLPNGGLQAESVAAGTGGANGPIKISASGSSRRGYNFNVHLENANSSVFGAFLVGATSGSTVPNLPGSGYYLTPNSQGVIWYPATAPFFLTNTLGELDVPVPVPTTALVGDIWYFQAAFFDTTISAPLQNYALSNGLAVTILDRRDDYDVNKVAVP